MKKLLIASLVAAAAHSANAQSAGIYVGTDLFSNKLSGVGRTGGLGMFGGYRFGNGAAVELSANRIGRYNVENLFTFSVNDFNISGLYGIQLSESLSAYGRLGYGSIRLSDKNRLASRGMKIDNGLMYGVGLNYQISEKIGVRGEFRKPASDISSVGVGVHYKF